MMWLELNLAVQSWVSSVKSSGLSTQPCGAPVLSVVVLEVLWPTRTDWGLPVFRIWSDLMAYFWTSGPWAFLLEIHPTIFQIWTFLLVSSTEMPQQIHQTSAHLLTEKLLITSSNNTVLCKSRPTTNHCTYHLLPSILKSANPKTRSELPVSSCAKQETWGRWSQVINTHSLILYSRWSTPVWCKQTCILPWGRESVFWAVLSFERIIKLTNDSSELPLASLNGSQWHSSVG